MDYSILFRRGINLEHEDEFRIAQQYFNVVELRSACPRDQIIIGRYSTLPYYDELYSDLQSVNSRLINSPREHRWIANFEYYEALKNYTAETWTDFDFYKCNHPGPFVLKGRTNSRKGQWATHMFAQDKKQAAILASELMNDPLIGPQGVLYRKYVPLVTLETGINGLPFANEWRLFYYKNKLLEYGYYWTQAEEPQKASLPNEGFRFADEVARLASQFTTFFVLDIAEKQSGGWLLVEVNDGQQSGLSFNDAQVLYSSLKIVLT